MVTQSHAPATPYTIKDGPWIRTTTDTFPAYHYKYKHCTVVVDGKELEGSIQYKRKHGRTEVITCFRDTCVLGSSPDWLIRMNQNQEHWKIKSK